MKQLRHGRNGPFLHLDGTGDHGLANELFSGVKNHHYPVERNARITQVISSAFAKSTIIPIAEAPEHTGKRAAENAQRREELRAVIDRHPEAAVFACKPVIDALGMADDPRASHFGAIRGLNKWEDRDTVIIVGRELPRMRDVERYGRAYAVRAGDTFTPAKKWKKELRGIRMADGTVYGVQVQTHPDPWAAHALEQIREAEIEQAIDRIRLIHNTRPKSVILIGSTPINATIDEAVSWSDFKQGGTRIDRVIEAHGFLPLSSREAARLFPDVWSESTARRDLEGASLSASNSYKNILIGKWRAKETCLVRYQAVVSKGKRAAFRNAIVFSSPESARRAVEAVVGPLKTLEIVSHAPASKEAMQAVQNTEERRASYEERAAIGEYDLGLSRIEAEIWALSMFKRPDKPQPPAPPDPPTNKGDVLPFKRRDAA